jgi:hypothetical protein
MIVVDTSVWIAYFRNQRAPAVDALAASDPNAIIVGDLILLECLQGARDEKHAAKLETELRAFNIAPIMNEPLAIKAARNYRRLRTLGVTPRSTVDLIIATFCIERGYRLLHQDRDFDPMVAHLGLRVV